MVIGAPLTVFAPLVVVDTFTVEAPALVNWIFPEGEPAATVLFNLTYIGVEATVPAAPTVTVDEKLELSLLTSKPAGGVTVIAAVKLVPETLNCCEDEFVP